MPERVVLKKTAPLPLSTPLRCLKRDDRFDTVEGFEVKPLPTPGLQSPSLVSLAHGPIRHIMLWYAGYPAYEDGTVPPHRHTFVDLLQQLPASTRVTFAVHPNGLEELQEIIKQAGDSREIELVQTPHHLAFSIWAEDACTVVTDASSDGVVETYLVEPYSFPRYGDGLVADLVAEASPDLASTQLPLSFQGGNMLIGDEFVLIGRDDLDESIMTAIEEDAIRDFPIGDRDTQERFIRQLFRDALDPSKEFHFLESQPLSRPPDKFVSEYGGKMYLNELGGEGLRQPIFHIDMFVSLAGRATPDGPYRVLVGDPGLADELLGDSTRAFNMQSEYDDIAAQLESLGFQVIRTPLPLVPALVDDRARRVEIEGNVVAVEGTLRWYHATSNNCLVQIDGDSRDVWLPTYGHGSSAPLATVDAKHREIWEGLGFTVHQLADFSHLAIALGALHCIKKYLSR